MQEVCSLCIRTFRVFFFFLCMSSLPFVRFPYPSPFGLAMNLFSCVTIHYIIHTRSCMCMCSTRQSDLHTISSANYVYKNECAWWLLFPLVAPVFFRFSACLGFLAGGCSAVVLWELSPVPPFTMEGVHSPDINRLSQLSISNLCLHVCAVTSD